MYRRGWWPSTFLDRRPDIDDDDLRTTRLFLEKLQGGKNPEKPSRDAPSVQCFCQSSAGRPHYFIILSHLSPTLDERIGVVREEGNYNYYE